MPKAVLSVVHTCWLCMGMFLTQTRAFCLFYFQKDIFMRKKIEQEEQKEEKEEKDKILFLYK